MKDLDRNIRAMEGELHEDGAGASVLGNERRVDARVHEVIRRGVRASMARERYDRLREAVDKKQEIPEGAQAVGRMNTSGSCAGGWTIWRCVATCSPPRAR